ncbi:uncharacterized protein LOC142319788 isoform X3 [Lycorma delicatula]|uniref:uncharacterized protein LOC142319788 isoform X3 n=1 Tax=Lycorma delicatula TaxID=130591 RepID=UPI003F50E573
MRRDRKLLRSSISEHGIAIEESSFKPLKCFRKDLITTDTIEWFKRKSVKSLTSIQIDKLDLLIGKLLEVGDLATVWCLEAVFHYKTKEVTSMDNPLILIENGCDDLHLGSKILNEQPMAGSEADNEQETGFLTKIKKAIFG